MSKSSHARSFRHRFLEVQYQRAAVAGYPEHTERTVLFLVDAWSLAQPDEAAAATIAAAGAAPEQETAAKQAVGEAQSAATRASEVTADISDHIVMNWNHREHDGTACLCTLHCQSVHKLRASLRV